MVIIFFEREFPGLNEHIKELARNRYKGGKLKKQETEWVKYTCQRLKIPPILHYPVECRFTWYLRNKKKDLDNIVFAKKYILDGLVEARVLKGDGQKYINFISDVKFVIGKNIPNEYGVEVVITPYLTRHKK